MPHKPIKEAIPDFLLKLYHILEKPQFSPYICWANEGSQVLIKNAKKVEVKVLPYFYRHRKLSSFIRQMNMYNFTRVNKISKQRNHMYFKNDQFRQGQMQSLRNIKRNQKSKAKVLPQFEEDKNTTDEKDQGQFKEKIIHKLNQIKGILQHIAKVHPSTEKDIKSAVELCNSAVEEETIEIDSLMDGSLLDHSFICEEVAEIEPLIIPSLCSLDYCV